LNKKVRKLGLCHALSQKLYEGNLIVVDQMTVPTFKTNPLAKILSSKFNITGSFGSTALLLDHQQKEAVHATDTATKDQNALVLGGVHANLRIASRNLFQVKLLNQMGANVYDIIKHEKLMISLSALQQLEQRLK
jgi:large subunit ribosomal protein L4